MEMLGTYPSSVKTKSFIHGTWPDKTKNQWFAISFLPCMYFSQFRRIWTGIISACFRKSKNKNTGHDVAVVIRITGCRWGRTNYITFILEKPRSTPTKIKQQLNCSKFTIIALIRFYGPVAMT